MELHPCCQEDGHLALGREPGSPLAGDADWHPLRSRSTWSLSLTSAGEAYLRRISPAIATIADATREAMGRTAQPSGLLRLTMPRAGYDGVVAPALHGFRKHYPLVEFELEIEGGLVGIAD